MVRMPSKDQCYLEKEPGVNGMFCATSEEVFWISQRALEINACGSPLCRSLLLNEWRFLRVFFFLTDRCPYPTIILSNHNRNDLRTRKRSKIRGKKGRREIDVSEIIEQKVKNKNSLGNHTFVRNEWSVME